MYPAQYSVSWCTLCVSDPAMDSVSKVLISGLLVHNSYLCLFFFFFFHFLESHLNVVGFSLVDRREVL